MAFSGTITQTATTCDDINTLLGYDDSSLKDGDFAYVISTDTYFRINRRATSGLACKSRQGRWTIYSSGAAVVFGDGSPIPSVPVVVGALYVDVATGSVYAGEASGPTWVAVGGGGGASLLRAYIPVLGFFGTLTGISANRPWTANGEGVGLVPLDGDDFPSAGWNLVVQGLVNNIGESPTITFDLVDAATGAVVYASATIVLTTLGRFMLSVPFEVLHPAPPSGLAPYMLTATGFSGGASGDSVTLVGAYVCPTNAALPA